MSTFYVLPSRPALGQRFADFLHQLFPGLHWSSASWTALAEALTAAAEQPDVYVIHRDDLSEDDDPAHALTDAFGANLGDEVVEVQLGAKPGELIATRWRLGA